MKILTLCPSDAASEHSTRNWVLGILTIGTFVYFGIPKLLGDPISVKGFNQFSPVIGLDPDAFRIFTGISEIAIALVLIGSLVLPRYRGLLAAAGYLFTLATMVSGLLIEFFVRTQPAIPLVVIALALIAVSIVQLKTPLSCIKSQFFAAKS